MNQLNLVKLMDQLDKLNLGPVELGNPNTYDKAKLCLFLFMPL